MNIKPLSDRIIVQRVEAESTKHGLIIPDTAREKPQEGQVIAVGRGRVLPDGKVLPLHVSAGDRILFAKFVGSEVNIGGIEYLILREDEVLGIVGELPGVDPIKERVAPIVHVSGDVPDPQESYSTPDQWDDEGAPLAGEDPVKER